MNDNQEDGGSDLIDAFLSLRDRDEALNFLRDLLTESELTEFKHRWQAAKMLFHKVPYTVIEKEIGLSSTTVARISKWLQNGTGGYRMILDRLESEAKNQQIIPEDPPIKPEE